MGVIIIVNVIRFYGTIYENYLEGLNKIALVRRIEALMSLGSIITSIVVLLLNSNILYLIIANQIWLVFNVIRNWYLARMVEEGKLRSFVHKKFDRELFSYIWKPAWRSGVSGLMSNGLTNLSGLLYAQIGDPKVVAPFLLSMRLITQIREVSMAPFYSKIPYLSQLRAQNRISELIKVVRRGMFMSHIVFVIGVIFVSFFLSICWV
ncbi:hypothetical protein [Sphingobacterium multivorum]|nr:hypothetical protein [Sphingobacterium multivorum]